MMLSKENKLLWTFGLFKVPLIKITGTKIVEHSAVMTVSSVPLNFLTKNHLGSLYLGALMIGAEVAAGFRIFYIFNEHKIRMSFSFKSLKADFLRRAESDVFFECKYPGLDDFVKKLTVSKEREEITMIVRAYCQENAEDTVASFTFILSAKILN